MKIQGRRMSPELPGHIEGSCLDCLVSFGAQDLAQSVGGRTKEDRGPRRRAERGGWVDDLKRSVFINERYDRATWKRGSTRRKYVLSLSR